MTATGMIQTDKSSSCYVDTCVNKECRTTRVCQRAIEMEDTKVRVRSLADDLGMPIHEVMIAAGWKELEGVLDTVRMQRLKLLHATNALREVELQAAFMRSKGSEDYLKSLASKAIETIETTPDTKPIPLPEDVISLLCSVSDNFGDMPVSEEWATKTYKRADALLQKYDGRFRRRLPGESTNQVGPLLFDAAAPPEVVKWLSEHPPINMVVLQQS